MHEYSISYKGLAEGEYFYDYHLNETFFEIFETEDLLAANLQVSLTFRKKSTHVELEFDINGTVSFPCDRCLEPVSSEIETQQKIYVKFGEAYAEEDENLYIWPESNNDIDVSKFINELIVVAFPMRKVHPDDSKGQPTCPVDMLKYIENINDDGSKIDPRWNELNKLKDGTS